jgi:hypothetical protein
MEARLGHDFSQVSIHAGTQAEESARALEAHAYTVGPDIVFGAGQFDPNSEKGQELLSHELTHVAQQSAGPVSGTLVEEGLAVSDPSDSFEQAAEHMARDATQAPAEPVDAGVAVKSARSSSHVASSSLSVQRCGATPCGCSPEKQMAHALHEQSLVSIAATMPPGGDQLPMRPPLVVQRDGDDDQPKKPPGLTDQYGPFDPKDNFLRGGWSNGKPSFSVDPGFLKLPGGGDPLTWTPPSGDPQQSPMAKPPGCPDDRWNKPGPWNMYTSSCCNVNAKFDDATHKCVQVAPQNDLDLPPIPPAPPPEYNDLPAPDPNTAVA